MCRHEIIGVVTKTGSDVKGFKEGDRVGVGCMAASCLECEHCKTDQENYCDKMVLIYNGVFWDGSITYGGYSKLIIADYRFFSFFFYEKETFFFYELISVYLFIKPFGKSDVKVCGTHSGEPTDGCGGSSTVRRNNSVHSVERPRFGGDAGEKDWGGWVGRAGTLGR